jgi:spore maturation protein CgeB
MKFVIFGLTVSSSWGNGHATLWRGLCRALGRRGHRVIFFERDVPYYAHHRDLAELPGGGELILYDGWPEILNTIRRHLSDCDVAMVTSYCPDAIVASRVVLDSRAQRVFYDLDAPVTLAALAAGQQPAYIAPGGLRDFDLVLSYSGGTSLQEIRTNLGARRVAPLYGSVDPLVHKPVPAQDHYRASLNYLGTWAEDRQAPLNTLFVETAKRLPRERFMLAGSKYEHGFEWQPNIYFLGHVAPPDHARFYCSSRITLNVTRQPMAKSGFCPSGRLFEAAACGVPILTDSWTGLDHFFEPGSEILEADSTAGAIAALDRSPEELARIAHAARERTLAQHTADVRAGELETILQSVNAPAIAETA